MKDEIFIASMAERIKVLRMAKGYSVRELGVLSGLDYSFLSRLENGQKSANVLTLKRIADALQVDVKEFL